MLNYNFSFGGSESLYQETRQINLSPEDETVQAPCYCVFQFKIDVSRLTEYLVYYKNFIKCYVTKLFKNYDIKKLID